MSQAVYFAAWLLAALVAIGFVSAAIARHLRWRELRHRQAVALAGALDDYLGWLGSLRRVTDFRGESPEAAATLDRAVELRIGWFPETAGEMAGLLATHNRTMAFLAAQQALRLADPEAWLDSDHDDRFLALWRLQRYAAQAIRDKLDLPAVAAPVPAARAPLAAAAAWLEPQGREENA